MSMGAWASDKEEGIEFTCQLGPAFFQLHIENDESKSWYKLQRESNEYVIQLLKKGRKEAGEMGGAIRLFNNYKIKNLDDYFDVPHFRIKRVNIRPDSIDIVVIAIPRSIYPGRRSILRVNRLTGELSSVSGRAGPSYPYYGNCEQGILSKISVKPKKERKF